MQENLHKELIQHRRYLHQNPETGLELPNTVAYVKKVLTEYGYTPKQCGNGITADIGTGNITVLLRADMDALPITEQSTVPYKSKKVGVMHACGHDMHTAMLLGAAKLLKEQEHQLNGRARLMFQPGEEVLEGAKNMLENGVLDAPIPKAAFMVHVSAGIPFKTGTLIVSVPGTVAPSSDHFCITIKGKGCHGSIPQAGLDPILAGANFLTAVQTLQTREFASENIILTFGIFKAGESANVIPESAVLYGTLRTFDEEIRTKYKERLQNLLKNCTAAFECTGSVCYTAECPTFLCDKSLSDFSLKIFKKAISSASIPKGYGSEDFAFISQKIPTVLVYLPAGDSRNGYPFPLHNANVTFDESALEAGARAYTDFAIQYLKNSANFN